MREDSVIVFMSAAVCMGFVLAARKLEVMGLGALNRAQTEYYTVA